jgi:transposase
MQKMNLNYYYKRSYLSEVFGISINSKTMTTLIKDLGSNRVPIIEYMRQLSGDKNLILMDATSIVSYSENLTRVAQGLTKYKSCEPLFNLLYFYCPDYYMPAYYRLFNGNIKHVKMITMGLQESAYKEAMIIADKGFYSKANLELLESQSLIYIIPMKGDSTLTKKSRYKKMTSTTNNFLFHERVIYHYSYRVNKNSSVYLIIDEAMMIIEKRDYIHRMKKHAQNHSEQDFTDQVP